MAWHKYATQHVPEWLSVRMTGLRESIEHIGFFAVSGLIAGLLYGSVIGWFKYDDLNADRIFRARMAEQAEINKQSENRMCREMPGHFMCGDNERRICTGNPNDARCKDYRECTTGPGLKQGWPKCAKYKDW
ncbi:hypothetical protein [Pseudomonas aeruginosa]|jgi:hypothetical protein